MRIVCPIHSPQQTRQAIEDGVGDIGVGPVFTTQTKEDVCGAVGFGYLEHVANTHETSLLWPLAALNRTI